MPTTERRPARLILFFMLAISGAAVDLATKSFVFAWLGAPGERPPFWLIENYVGIETSLNKGALFGMGQGQVPLFAAVSVIAMLGILYWVFFGDATSELIVTLALGLIMGGVIGNLYDRLGLWGGHAVRDWILFRWQDPRWTWPNFNIADSLLVCGAALLVWHALRNPAPSAAASTNKTALAAHDN